jgi:glycosyltransferase involved in cell wall biosynthesis
MKISIAMATYNGASYLQEQLDSFAAQTWLPDELLVSDDGSKDETLSILDRFAGSAPFLVRIVRNELNLGYTQNFAKAMSMCTGDLVFLSDQDDVWYSNKIERIVEIAERTPGCWLLIHDGEIADARATRSGLTKMGQMRSGLGSSHAALTGALSVVSRQFLALALPVPVNVVGHDVWLHKLCGCFANRRIVLEECLQIIRRHADNTSEWVINSSYKVSPLDIFRSQVRIRPAIDYRDRMSFNFDLQHRLTEMAKVSGLSIQDREGVQRAMRHLAREKIALLARQSLVRSGPIARRFAAFRMLLRRDYVHFNGLRSFIRDVLR